MAFDPKIASLKSTCACDPSTCLSAVHLRTGVTSYYAATLLKGANTVYLDASTFGEPVISCSDYGVGDGGSEHGSTQPISEWQRSNPTFGVGAVVKGYHANPG
jgi:hypothetical protein